MKLLEKMTPLLEIIYYWEQACLGRVGMMWKFVVGRIHPCSMDGFVDHSEQRIPCQRTVDLERRE